ncbi:MAG: aminoacyl-tRNA hydrolase, partial [Candidatus Pacearchaeota archaeon]|nr:aminoacyl-tRNA hydrolase [Candidatus Pacearchaeota archaeon]
MTIIVGLGNPGKKYEQTRHNAGFLALDMLARHWQCDEWRQDKKSGSLLAECARPGLKQPILLVKPQTFM